MSHEPAFVSLSPAVGDTHSSLRSCDRSPLAAADPAAWSGRVGRCRERAGGNGQAELRAIRARQLGGVSVCVCIPKPRGPVTPADCLVPQPAQQPRNSAVYASASLTRTGAGDREAREVREVREVRDVREVRERCNVIPQQRPRMVKRSARSLVSSRLAARS